jgi:hypothetical protein
MIVIGAEESEPTMNNEIANLPATTTQIDALAAINDFLAEADPQNMIGKLLKFSKGEFLKGQDAEVIPEGTLYTVACDMALSGFIRWHDGKPAEHKLVRIATGAPLYRREELGHDDKDQWPTDAKGEPRDPWQATIYVPIMDHDGELATFTTSSGSGLKSVHRLLRRYVTHVARHPDVYPLIKLKKSFWVHSDKAIGKVFYPDFEPAGWVDRAEFIEALEVVGVIVETVAPKELLAPKDEVNDAIPF